MRISDWSSDVCSSDRSEAAKALGLSPAQTMGRIVMPQALRIAIPPMTSWHLNTIKNSSLGVAIGYPEFVSVVDTVISQTGQAIEGVEIGRARVGKEGVGKCRSRWWQDPKKKKTINYN